MKLITVGLMVIMVISLLACSPAAPDSVSWEVPIDNFMNQPNHSDEIEVPTGNVFILSLGSNPTTGFSWSEAAQIADTGILKQVSHEIIAPEGNALGASGKEVWTFETLKKGTTTVGLEYSRPWEDGETAEWTYEITVTVN